MTVQFKDGIPLFKESGIPAMDPDCCCEVGVCDHCGGLASWNALRVSMVWDVDSVGYICDFWNGVVIYAFLSSFSGNVGCEFNTFSQCKFPITTYPNMTINYAGFPATYITVIVNVSGSEQIIGTEFEFCPPTGEVVYDAVLGVTITVEFLTI